MPRNQSSNKRGVTPTKQTKPAKSGTPVRNALLLIIFAVALVALVVIMPKEPMRPTATVLAPGGQASGQDEAEALPLRISEVMASNKRAYPDEHGNFPDWIEIHNTSDAPVNLNGVGISDRDDRVLFLFPNIDLPADGRIVVFCDDTNQAERNAPLHARFKISALGETLYLFDRSALVFDSVEVPPLNSDFSYALTSNGWTVTEHFTPGYPNTDEGYERFRAEAVASADGLVINEIVASNRTTLQDEDGEYPDWIELYNGGSLTIDLHNYALSDDEDNLVKWRFPQGAQIKPGEYYVVFASGKDRPGGDGRLPHTSFSLAADGETVMLSDILSQTLDRVQYENLATDVSWGRVEGLDNAWQVYQQPTPGMPNTRASEVRMDAYMRARNQSGVFISEVMSSSTGVETPYGVTSYDWIELVNLGSQAVDLTGWGLSDSVSRPRKWQFSSASIGPGEHMLVFPSGESESPTGSGAIHAEFRLSALGETIVLCTPDGTIQDKLVIPKLERDNSYGRNFDQGGLFYYETPTPAAANTSQGFFGYTTPPTTDVKGGIYNKPVTVAATAAPGARIRYTLDGSEPTEAIGMDYTGPIVVSENAALRLRAFSSDYKPSDILTETFLINIYPSLPVIALTADPQHLWDPESGILAEDEELKATLTAPPFKQLAYWQKNRYPANFEYFTAEGEQQLNQVIEIQLNGQYSMDQAQKSFRITARSRYGKGTLAYPFFSDRPYSEYQSVVLRNGGQDGKYTRIIDGLQSRIIDWTDSTVLHMATTPVLCYLNGEYWGHYNLRDRINKHTIAAYEGWLDAENIDFIKGDNKVISGTFTNYKQLREYVKAHDLNNPEALQRVLDWIDVENYFDFMIFQIYFGNTDAGNIKYYRERRDGAKWRWVVFDLDWGYFASGRDGCYVWLKPEGAGAQRFDNSLIRGLLAVPQMRDQFLTRFGELFQDYLSDTDRIRAEADRMLAEIEPELPMHFNRWAGLTSPVISEEPSSPEGLESYWRSQVARMQNVLKKRPNLCWQHVKDWFDLTEEEMVGYFGPQPEMPADAIL